MTTSHPSASGPDGPAPSAAQGPRHSRRATAWLLAAVALVIGLFAGGIIVGVVSDGSSTPTANVTVTRTPTAMPSAGSSASSGVSVEANANAACLRAVDDARESYSDLSDLVSALRSLDAKDIDHVIQRLEPLQTRLSADLHDCKVTTRLPDGSTTTSTPPPLVPSATKT